LFSRPRQPLCFSPQRSEVVRAGRSVARPFLLCGSVAFSTPEHKLYNRLSFVNAGNQGALAKGFQ
jgi:hypothetical protein